MLDAVSFSTYDIFDALTFRIQIYKGGDWSIRNPGRLVYEQPINLNLFIDYNWD